LYDDWEQLVQQILSVNLTPETAREIINTPAVSTKERAFKTIIKNRVCYGGIMANGSGLIKRGENGKGLLSRWYPDTLAERIKIIVSLKDRLEFIEGDALDCIQEYAGDENVCFFVDPPYTASGKKAGRRLYQYNEIDHDRLFILLQKLNGKFMLTYDLDKAVIELAEKHGLNYYEVAIKGTHNLARHELIISK
jgi:DNA adenine methylase